MKRRAKMPRLSAERSRREAEDLIQLSNAWPATRELVRRCRSDTHEVAPNTLKKPLLCSQNGGQKKHLARTRAETPFRFASLFINRTRPPVNYLSGLFSGECRLCRACRADRGLFQEAGWSADCHGPDGILPGIERYGCTKNGAAGSPLSSQLDPPRRGPTPLPKGADPSET